MSGAIIGDIVSKLAEAYWGIPTEIREKALELLSADMRTVINQFTNKFGYEF